MTKTSTTPTPNNNKNINTLFSGCTSVRSARTKLQRWRNKGIPLSDKVHYGRISAGYTSQRISLKSSKKHRTILDYTGSLKENGHCIVRGAIDSDAIDSILSDLSPHHNSNEGWCPTVQFTDQVFQKPLIFKSHQVSDIGFSVGSSTNTLPFLSTWLQGILRLNFPHLKFASIFLLKNNVNITTWKTDPFFHKDIPPDWTGDTSGIDERAEAPMVLWFPLQRTVALDYKYHICKTNPQPKVNVPTLDVKPTDLLMFDRNTFLHRSSKPIYPNCRNFRVLIILSTNLDELLYKK
jgi:hypothetical protein